MDIKELKEAVNTILDLLSDGDYQEREELYDSALRILVRLAEQYLSVAKDPRMPGKLCREDDITLADLGQMHGYNKAIDKCALAMTAMLAEKDEEIESLKKQKNEWIKANSPNGWIDSLRKERDELKKRVDELGKGE